MANDLAEFVEKVVQGMNVSSSSSAPSSHEANGVVLSEAQQQKQSSPLQTHDMEKEAELQLQTARMIRQVNIFLFFCCD